MFTVGRVSVCVEFAFNPDLFVGKNNSAVFHETLGQMSQGWQRIDISLWCMGD